MKKIIKLCVLNKVIRKSLERTLLARVAQVSAFPFFVLATTTASKLNMGKYSPGKVLSRSNEISMPYLKKVD